MSATGGSIAVGGSITTSGGSINVGPSDDQLQRTILSVLQQAGWTPEKLAAFVREPERVAQQKIELGQKLSVTQKAIVTFLQILGEKDIATERLPEALAQIAVRHRQTLEALGALTTDDPVVKTEIEEARAAFDTGNYDRADTLLMAAKEADLAAMGRDEAIAAEATNAAKAHRLSCRSIDLI